MSKYKQHSDKQNFSSDVLSVPTKAFSMQPAELFQDESYSDTRQLKQKKYCKQCWRKDFHFRTNYSPVVMGFLIVATCGLALLIRPSRCVCCGTMRIN